MSEDSYPTPDDGELVKRVSLEDQSNIRRDWIGNDANACAVHGKVKLNENPLRLRLSWKNSSQGTVRLIGVYDLNLEPLLSGDFVRIEKKSDNEIRLRFFHSHDGLIYIQVNSDGPKLPIGVMN